MINKKNNFIVNINYLTNFNPLNFKNFNKFDLINKNKIYCRNFFLFLFLLKYLNKNKFCNKINLFIKPLKKKYNNILRAPYKNKLSKHQLGVYRYNILITFYFLKTVYTYKNINNFFYFFNNFNNFFNFLESNLIYNYKLKIFFNFKIPFNFLIKKYLI